MSFDEYVVNEAAKNDAAGFNPEKETTSDEFNQELTPGKKYTVKKGEETSLCIYQGNTDGVYIFNPEAKEAGVVLAPCEYTEAELDAAIKAGEIVVNEELSVNEGKFSKFIIYAHNDPKNTAKNQEVGRAIWKELGKRTGPFAGKAQCGATTPTVVMVNYDGQAATKAELDTYMSSQGLTFEEEVSI
jgi:hypothetical protein